MIGIDWIEIVVFIVGIFFSQFCFHITFALIIWNFIELHEWWWNLTKRRNYGFFYQYDWLLCCCCGSCSCCCRQLWITLEMTQKKCVWLDFIFFFCIYFLYFLNIISFFIAFYCWLWNDYITKLVHSSMQC